MDYPIVFIPGLFGSLGDDVIRGTGDFSFGLAQKVYRPFIEILNSMGYIEGEDLFVSYYDWKKSVLEAVDKYLFLDIEKIKRQTGSQKVIIIGHSLGGLLGRTYMTYFSPSSVDKLIMIGSPNLGAVNAYYFWCGGKLPYSKVKDSILYNAVKLGFILYYNFYHNIDSINMLRKIFPIAKDLLPSYGYGNYLCLEESDKIKDIDIEDMFVNNSFLNLLEEAAINQDNVYIISGYGKSTNESLMVDIKDKEKIKWVDGKPLKDFKTNDGDGTVTTFSTLGNLCANNIVLEGNHTEILYKAKEYLSYILQKPILKEVKVKRIEKAHMILATNCSEINIVTSDHNEVSSKSINIIDDKVQIINLGNDIFWIMVTGDDDLEITIDAKSNSKFKPMIYKGVLT